MKSPKLTLFRDRDDPYLEDKRIELDSIIQKVGSESFWKYVVHKLETEFPAPRDYREIVPEPKPEDYYPDKINEFLKRIINIPNKSILQSGKRLKNHNLKKLQVDDKKEEIDESLRHIVQEEDKGIQKIIAKLEELGESIELPELNEEEEEGKE